MIYVPEMGIAENIARALSTDHRARQRAREDILIRFRRLSWEDQYKVYEVVQGYFFHNERGSVTLRETRERSDCVSAVQQVAKHLGLPEGEMPTVETYERVRKELGLEISSSLIRRRWGGSWHEVAKAATGQKVQMNARQRAIYGAAIRQKMKGEDWLTGIREWLHERGPSRAEDDYNAWARERNEKNPKLPPVASGIAVRNGLVLPWSVALEVAKGKVSLADAQARELIRLEAEDGEFVGLHAIALIHGVSTGRARHMTGDKDFPVAYAFTLHERRVWLLTDIKAHHANDPFPRRTNGWLQPKIMTGKDICRMFGLTTKQLEGERRRHSGSRIPRPAGQVGGIHYWFRIAVEAWLDGARS